MRRPAYKLLSDQRRGHEFALGFQFCKEPVQSSPVEFPFKRPWFSIAQFFVQPQSLLDLLQAGEVVWGQHLSLDNREVDLYLIEPAGMHRRMNQDRLAVGLPQSAYCCLATVRGAVVHDPEDATGRSVRLAPHHLIDQSAKRVDSSPFLASTQDSTAANVPSGKILQRASSLVLVFDSHGASRSCRQSWVTPDAGLDARLLIRTDDVVPATKWFALPRPSVQVQDAFSFFGELRVAWEDPVLVPPGFDRIRVENSPDGAGTDRSAQVRRSSTGQVSGREPAQWQLGSADRLTGDRLDDRPVARGKRRACARGPLDQPMRSCHMPSDGASGGRNWSAAPPELRPPRSIGLVTRGAREPTAPSGDRRTGQFACERGSDTYQETRQGRQVGRKALGLAWCDSIRKRRSAIQPNASRIGHATYHRNPSINCEMGPLSAVELASLHLQQRSAWGFTGPPRSVRIPPAS